MRRLLAIVIAVAVIAVAAVVVQRLPGSAVTDHHGGRGQRAQAPLHVDTAAVQRRPMPIVLQAVGQVQSEHSVQIRPQVGGVLKRVFFNEGDRVQAGQRLFEIDPAPYQAQLVSAKAAWENTAAEYQRLAPLLTKDYVTAEEAGNARAAADQARAAYDQARINLSYTEIRAPIAGLTGSLTVKAGNVVAPGDTAPLVVINQMDPIVVQFSVPQQALAQIRRYQAAGTIRVFVTKEDGTGQLGEGRLVFIDNNVDSATATVNLKARIANTHEVLWPGQYVGVRLQLAVQPDALVLPQTAVQVGQDGNYVYRVKEGKAEVADIKVDRELGDDAIIASGVAAGDVVITRVPRSLRSGAAVITGAAPAAAARHPQGR